MLSSELGSLLHLASPTLPIGGFSYSQGLESAISNGLINNAQQAKRWIQDHLEGVIANSEAVVWVYLYHAWRAKDVNQIAKWNTWFWASRETSEFRNETEQMGWSLFKLIQEESKTEWKEMYKVFNMGHRMEIYVNPSIAETIIEISKSFNIDAQIVGRVENAPSKKLTIQSSKGTFEYEG
jgi:urease accessory protein UreF